jgi:hypothetical protein
MALLSHCYAVILALPFALGEILRSVQQRRIDAPVWLAFACSIPALAFYPVLIKHSMDPAGHIPAYIPTMWTFPGFYFLLLRPALFWLIPFTLLTIFLTRAHRRSGSLRSIFPDHEMLALMGFLLAPLVLVAMTMARSQIFSFR